MMSMVVIYCDIIARPKKAWLCLLPPAYVF